MTPTRTVLAGCLTAASLAFAGSSSATVVERVVAIVGDQAILLSELRERARPFVMRVEQQSADGAQRAAATSQLYGQLLDRMIDEELEQKAANRANLAVTPREIEEALGRVAAQNGVTIERVVDEAVQSGLTEQSYRQELRRQLLEAKLLNLRVQGRLRVTDEDVRIAYQKLVADERKKLDFDAAWIRIAAPATLKESDMKARRAEAERILGEARAGADFGALARRYSADAATREAGGALGRVRPGRLPPALDAAAQALAVGEISEPVRSGGDFVILKVERRDPSKLPSLEEAKEELGQRVYMEKMGRARQHWIEGLRRQNHVEIRL